MASVAEADSRAARPDVPSATPRLRRASLLVLLIAAALPAGCGSSRHSPDIAGIPAQLLRQARPIGSGPRFHPPASGPVIGACRPQLGARIEVHVEVFAASRVVIVPAGIGTRPPRTVSAGRITRARCYGDLVTLDPTGVVLVRSGARLAVSAIFRSWGQPLSASRLVSFTAAAGDRVSAFVDGRRWTGSPQAVPLTPHAEIVLEVGPHVPPHASFTFPPDA
jgi:hypothetical protein